jgi:ABC-type branched-subunit amino acid transport system substrate-binding protein
MPPPGICRLFHRVGECTRGALTRQARHVWQTVVVLLLWTLLSADAAFEGARYSRGAERLFTRGIAAYDVDNLDEARASFRALVALPANQRSGAALLMLTRTLIRLGNQATSAADAASAYNAAIDAARELTRQAPNSRYVADARLLAGDGYHQLKRFYEAATEYSRVLQKPTPIAVRASAAERLAAIVRNRAITTGALDRIRLQLGSDRLRDALLFGEARWYGRLGWAAQSEELFAAYADSFGSAGMFHSLVGTGSADSSPLGVMTDTDVVPGRTDIDPDNTWMPRAGREDVPRIGILAPMSGPRWERDIGRDLVAGVTMANEEMGEPFELVVVNTGSEHVVVVEGEEVPIYQSEAGRLIRVVAGTRYLVDEVGVVALIGPVFSTSCVAAAAVAEAAGVPLIAPLAQQSGLDTVGTHLFQLNPAPEVQGQALAEYATLVLGLETLAILSPLSDYGYAFQQAFTETAASNGGRVVHSDWYFAEATDFKVQFQSLRHKGFRLMPSAGGDSLALFDSLETALLDTSIAGEWVFRELVRADGLSYTSSQPDSSDLPVDAIDGVTIVVEHFDDAARIAPQLHFHRLQTQMLGNDVWNDAAALSDLQRTERVHMLGAAFVSRRAGSTGEQDFIDRYRLRTRRDDIGYGAAGFDAANLVLRGWASAHQTRADLRQFLADVRQYEGASGRISFSSTGQTNSEMALLTIDGAGQIRPLRADDLPTLGPVFVDSDFADSDLPTESVPPADGASSDWELPESPR